MKGIGEIAFDRYRETQNNRGVDGRKLKPWTELSEAQQEEWERAAIQLSKASQVIKGQRTRPSGR